MTKALVTVSVTYGKNSGEEVNDRYIITDTPENRAEVVDEELNGWDIYDSTEDFINGRINLLQGDTDGGGDWDDPTGRIVEISTKEEELSSLKFKYDKEVSKIEEMFKEI